MAFLWYLLLYLGTTLAYSLALKRVVLVDVIILSGLYTIRMLAGAAATATKVSPWLAAFAIFLFLSLAMVKRFSELQNLHARGMTPANGRGYLVSDIEQLRSFWNLERVCLDFDFCTLYQWAGRGCALPPSCSYVADHSTADPVA